MIERRIERVVLEPDPSQGAERAKQRVTLLLVGADERPPGQQQDPVTQAVRVPPQAFVTSAGVEAAAERQHLEERGIQVVDRAHVRARERQHAGAVQPALRDDHVERSRELARLMEAPRLRADRAHTLELHLARIVGDHQCHVEALVARQLAREMEVADPGSRHLGSDKVVRREQNPLHRHADPLCLSTHELRLDPR